MGHFMKAGSLKWSHEELVYQQFPVPITSRASLETRIEFLVDCFSLGSLSVLAHFYFFKGGRIFFLTRLWLGCPTLTQVGSTHHSAPPPPGGSESFPLFMALSFVCVCVGGLQSAHQLCWTMVPSRADDVLHSPGGVVVILSRSGIESAPVQAGSSQRFCVHEVWWVQDAPDTCRTHSVLLCVVFLQEKRKVKKKKKKNRFPAGGLTAASL
jgi:hypothetical protein